MATAGDEVDATMENKSPSTTQRETKTLSRGLLTHSRSLLSTLLSPSQPLQCSILVAQNPSIFFLVLNLYEICDVILFLTPNRRRRECLLFFPIRQSLLGPQDLNCNIVYMSQLPSNRELFKPTKRDQEQQQ